MSFKLGLAVDALSPELTGIGRYCWELTSRLPAKPDVASITYWRGDDQVRDPQQLLKGERLALPFGEKARKWVLRRAKSVGLANDSALWPRHHGIELFHGPNFMLPPWIENGIITVHDLSVFLFPETHPVARIRSFERSFESSLKRASHIITPTETVRQELIAFAALDPHTVSAVPMGVSAAFSPVRGEELERSLAQLGLPNTGYGLALAALEPRKRIDRLLCAWERIPDGLRNSYPLVIAGAPGWKNETLQERIADAVAKGWARSLGYVDECALPALYSGARLFVYPSMYEGFGMPPIEAMACGTPVAVSNTSCLSEVSRGAALLIDPEDIDGTARALAEALTNEAQRREMIARGIEVAGSLTWDRCVTETLEAYARV